MARLSVYKLLWWLTIAGGAVRHCSYLLVPFIIAENPDIDGREAPIRSGKKAAERALQIPMLIRRILQSLFSRMICILTSLPGTDMPQYNSKDGA